MTMENAGIKSNAPRLSEKSSPKIRVLVADDERGARMALEAPLRLRGFEVVAVASGQVAVEIGQKDFFDVLLTDVYMPGMNGLEVVREFRRFSPETKIIVMTGQGSMETAMQAVEQGAFDFIAKPFDIEEVL
ncbi:MAG: response regulator, partial [Acidobacteriota bacterium]|nr:response regulator [Acidobacteriota bacterium]